MLHKNIRQNVNYFSKPDKELQEKSLWREGKISYSRLFLGSVVNSGQTVAFHSLSKQIKCESLYLLPSNRIIILPLNFPWQGFFMLLNSGHIL